MRRNPRLKAPPAPSLPKSLALLGCSALRWDMGGPGCSQNSGAWDLFPPRLHPVAVTLQRYTTQEVILQDYRIPPKVSMAAGTLLTLTRFTRGSGWRWDLVHGGVTQQGAAMGLIWGWIPALHPLPAP